MRRLMSLMVCGAALAAATAHAAELTAAQIAEKNAAARGGLQAWRAVNTLAMSGQMDAGGKQDAKLPFVMDMKRPHKSRLEIRFQDQTAVQTYDGAQGWKYRPFLGRTEAEPLTANELRLVAAADELDGPLIDYAQKGIRIELQGTDKIDGKSAYRLRLTNTRTGAQRNLWVDASTFLDVKVDGEPRKLDNKLHKVAVYYRDYQSVGGLTLPHTLETVVDGVRQTHKIVIQNVKVNPPLDDALFLKPQASLAKAAAAQ